MSEGFSKAALLEQIEREQAFWDQLVEEIGPERMLQPGAAGDWTFKDVVAHLSGWRSGTQARLDAALHGHTPAPPPWPADLDENDDRDLEEINSWIYRANRDRPLQEVLDEYRQSFVRIREAATALSERDLGDPERYAWMKGHPLADTITASFGHYHEEHEDAVRQWLGRA